MGEPRPWKECPECLGYGTLLQHPGSRKPTAHMGATGTDGWPAILCPTCAAYWRGVDEAVKAERHRWLDEAKAVNESLCGDKWSAFDALRCLCDRIRKEGTNGK